MTTPSLRTSSRAAGWRTLLLALFASLAACGGPDEPLDEAEVEAAIIGGEPDREHPAVGQVGHAEGDTVRWLCTGTLVGRRTVLTAAHCLFGPEGRRVTAPRLRFLAGGRRYAIERSAVAPDYAPRAAGAWNDLAVLRLAAAPPELPIPLASDPPRVGDGVAVVGFGVSMATGRGEGTGAGLRRIARVSLDRVQPKEVAYLFRGQGACYGDSGGPLLFGEGLEAKLVAVTSRGTTHVCRGLDTATRADAFIAWIRRSAERDLCEGACSP